MDDNIGEIWSLDLTSIESKLICTKLKQYKLEPTVDGLKTWLLAEMNIRGQNLTPESEENSLLSSEAIESAINFAKNNPNIVKGAGAMLGNIFKKRFLGQ